MSKTLTEMNVAKLVLGETQVEREMKLLNDERMKKIYVPSELVECEPYEPLFSLKKSVLHTEESQLYIDLEKMYRCGFYEEVLLNVALLIEKSPEKQLILGATKRIMEQLPSFITHYTHKTNY